MLNYWKYPDDDLIKVTTCNQLVDGEGGGGGGVSRRGRVVRLPT